MPDKQGQDDVRAETLNDGGEEAIESADAVVTHSRRTVMSGGAKLLVYSAPLIQLFRPSEALAASGMSSSS